MANFARGLAMIMSAESASAKPAPIAGPSMAAITGQPRSADRRWAKTGVDPPLPVGGPAFACSCSAWRLPRRRSARAAVEDEYAHRRSFACSSTVMRSVRSGTSSGLWISGRVRRISRPRSPQRNRASPSALGSGRLEHRDHRAALCRRRSPRRVARSWVIEIAVDDVGEQGDAFIERDVGDRVGNGPGASRHAHAVDRAQSREAAPLGVAHAEGAERARIPVDLAATGAAPRAKKPSLACVQKCSVAASTVTGASGRSV